MVPSSRQEWNYRGGGLPYQFTSLPYHLETLEGGCWRVVCFHFKCRNRSTGRPIAYIWLSLQPGWVGHWIVRDSETLLGPSDAFRLRGASREEERKEKLTEGFFSRCCMRLRPPAGRPPPPVPPGPRCRLPSREAGPLTRRLTDGPGARSDSENTQDRQTARPQHRSAGSPPAHTAAAPDISADDFCYLSRGNSSFCQNSVFLIWLGAASRSLLHSDRMSELSVNDHLEGILSDFEGM